MSWTVYRSSQALKTEHYNDVLVISYSSQGHAKPDVTDLSSINWFFSPRSFKARRKVVQLSNQLISSLLAKLAYVVTDKTGSSSLSLSAVPTIEIEITQPRRRNLYVHSTKRTLKFHISLKAKRNFTEFHVGCMPWIAGTIHYSFFFFKCKATRQNKNIWSWIPTELEKFWFVVQCGTMARIEFKTYLFV